LERVAVIYGLDTIGNNNWYAWGAESLVATQAPDGSWTDANRHTPNSEIGTAFALLFLNRANVAKDLTAALKGRVKDPGLSTLKGGSGNTAKVGPERNPPKTNPTDPPPRSEPVVPNPPPAAVTGNEFEKEAARLCASLVNASGADRNRILAHLRDSKGSMFTEALARAAAKLPAESQQEARAALAQRLTRMTAATLREMLRDDNREVRMAAATACGSKTDNQLEADLIAALSDSDSLVVQSARSSLKTRTGKDFGPDSSASAEERSRSIPAWKSWWQTQPK
jgi:hypothetical protein